MSAETPLVALRGIVKEFPGVRANDGVDFDLPRGEIHALLGENGAGKTTLMNVAAATCRTGGKLLKSTSFETGRSSPPASDLGPASRPANHFSLMRSASTRTRLP